MDRVRRGRVMFSRGSYPLRSVYARAREEDSELLPSDAGSVNFRSSGLDFLAASVYLASLTLRPPCERTGCEGGSSSPLS